MHSLAEISLHLHHSEQQAPLPLRQRRQIRTTSFRSALAEGPTTGDKRKRAHSAFNALVRLCRKQSPQKYSTLANVPLHGNL